MASQPNTTGNTGENLYEVENVAEGMLHEATHSVGTDACGLECSRECGAYGQERSRVGWGEGDFLLWNTVVDEVILYSLFISFELNLT